MSINYYSDSFTRLEFIQNFVSTFNSKKIHEFAFFCQIPNLNLSNILNILQTSICNFRKKDFEQTLFKQFPIKYEKDFNSLVQLEAEILKLEIPFSDFFVGIELPLNVRAAHSKINNKYLSLDYPTDMIHCDPWSGEPLDIFNALLYIAGDLETYCNFKNISNEYHEKLLRQFGTMKYIDPGFNGLTQNVSQNVEPGNFVFFDSFLPHNTIRSGATNRGRISLDFRFRIYDPYIPLLALPEDSLPPYKYIKYWYLPNIHIDNFSDRITHELDMIKEKFGYGKIYKFREASIDLYYKKK